MNTKKSLQILLFDFGLSKDILAAALSMEFGLIKFDFFRCIIKHLQVGDELSRAMMNKLNKGELLTNEIIGEMLERELNEFEGKVLLIDYPRTLSQFLELKGTLELANFELDKIWYFKIDKPNEFWKRTVGLVDTKQYLSTLDDEKPKDYKEKFEAKKENILSMQTVATLDYWKVIPIEFDSELNIDEIQTKIKENA